MTTSAESVIVNSMGPVGLVNFLAMIVLFVCSGSRSLEKSNREFDNRSLLVVGKCGHSFHMVYTINFGG